MNVVGRVLVCIAQRECNAWQEEQNQEKESKGLHSTMMVHRLLFGSLGLVSDFGLEKIQGP